MTIPITVHTQKPTTPFPHYWELCVGSCHAIMGTRADWRQQLQTAHTELGFQYVRFHGLLDDAMSVYVKDQWRGTERLSFFNIDSIFDFLLSIGMKPFLELGFMPTALASGEQTVFHYKANVTPPADYDKWAWMIEMLARHLVARYGLDEVRTWFFEVWNEPNLPFFWASSQAEYFKLYAHTARAIKRVDAALRVGGPATSINAWLPEMIAYCQRTDTPLDFLSTHHYPTDDPLWRKPDLPWDEFMKVAGQYQRGVLYEMTAKARQEAGDLPLYYTEWNTSAMVPDPLHDEPYAAAFIAKTLADASGLVQGYSFWTFTDLFEEGGQLSAPFHGGFGLQTVHGIRKPSYRLFELLHRLGDRRLEVETPPASKVEALAVADEDGLTVLVYYTDVPTAALQEEEVCLRLEGWRASAPARLVYINSEHANPKKRWQEFGSPEYPTQAQLAEIAQASNLAEEVLAPDPDGAFHLRLPLHAVVALRV